ncbi:hypothetical protein ACLIMP_12025 [Novosphingobium aerophilum]|uniref:hypothetical protein n=1 Tax=Novosphingobium TaxID=165696 RepID=UPI00163D6CD0|nr:MULTISPECIES: hypothetical protein [unclassified Novosphingobium]WRT91995.1 hypothetical protein U9J33_12345 [Novosphingobium sp. RL4]
MTRALRNTPFLALALVSGAPAIAPLQAKSPPPPVPGGLIGTMELGQYSCEKDGTAGGPVGIRLPQYDFRVVSASNYKTPDGVRGSYLMTGDRVVMTGGELKGMRMHRMSKGFLRLTGPDGQDSDMRCILTRGGRGNLKNSGQPDT